MAARIDLALRRSSHRQQTRDVLQLRRRQGDVTQGNGRYAYFACLNLHHHHPSHRSDLFADGAYVLAGFSSGVLKLFDMTLAGNADPEDRFGYILGRLDTAANMHGAMQLHIEIGGADFEAATANHKPSGDFDCSHGASASSSSRSPVAVPLFTCSTPLPLQCFLARSSAVQRCWWSICAVCESSSSGAAS